jgi:hypothetical protein
MAIEDQVKKPVERITLPVFNGRKSPMVYLMQAIMRMFNFKFAAAQAIAV